LQVLEEIDELKKDLSKREKEVAVLLAKIEAEKKMIQERMAQDEIVWKQQTNGGMLSRNRSNPN